MGAVRGRQILANAGSRSTGEGTLYYSGLQLQAGQKHTPFLHTFLHLLSCYTY